MQGAAGPPRERAILQSLLKIEGDPRVLIGMQFQYRPPRKLDQERVEVRVLDETGEMFTVKQVGGDEVYEREELGQLSIGKGRKANEPLIEMISQHGFDPGPFMQREESRIPTGRSGSVSSSPRRGMADRENVGGFVPFRGATPRPGFGNEREDMRQRVQEVRGLSVGGPRVRRTPFGEFEAVETGQGRPGPFAPAATRRRQVPFQDVCGVSPQVPPEGPFNRFQGGQQGVFQAPQQFGQAVGGYPAMEQQGVPPGDDVFQGQGYGGTGGFNPQNQLYGDPVAPGGFRAPGYPQPRWGEQQMPAGFRGGGGRQGSVPIGAGRRSPVGSEGSGGRLSGRGLGEANKELVARLDAFEKKLNTQSARTGIEAEMRRQQAQISQEKNPGLFAQMEIASTIYSAPEGWKGIIALMEGLSAVLKVPTSKLAFLGDELVLTGLQKCREAGKNLTDEQVAAIENSVLETYRAKKAKAKELAVGQEPGLGQEGISDGSQSATILESERSGVMNYH